MAIDPSILDLLVCPESHQPLALAAPGLLDDVNARIERGALHTHGGAPVDAPLAAGLLRADGKCIYRVDDDIPNLLIDDRIDL